MKKLFVVVEGETEERFVRKLLYPHFINLGIHIEAQQWITNRKLKTAGGGGNFDLIEGHLRRLMAKYIHDKSVSISTMIDLYAFPKGGKTIYDDAIEKLPNGLQKALLLEKRMENLFRYWKFIPYIQLYEFETLLLSKIEALGTFYTDHQSEILALASELGQKQPEEINETPQGAPSKRIIKHIPQYKKQKTSAGIVTAEAIGLSYIRQKCGHFNEWITKLENI